MASSQAYVRRFGDTPIDRLQPAKHEEALKWLSRDLDDAIVRFISSCACGDQLLACFYEFRYQPVAAELKGAIDRGVDVRIIIDAKVNGRTDGQGVVHESFPREENLALLAGSGIPDAQVIRRQARKSDIQHNKFMVRIAGGTQPVEVWTGSTNLSTGGIHGQTNVGHWVRDTAVADQFARYWQLLAGDPGGAVGDTRGQTISKNKVFKAAVRELSPAPLDLTEIPHGVTAVFSPRPDTSLLDSYAELLDSAGRQACITLAFGIASTFKEVLKDNTSASHLVFMLLEKRDRPSGNNPAEYVRINASNNVYQAWGSFLRDPVYQWVAETSALQLGLNRHVSFIHSKFMLIDPLSADPIIVTGSANFSADSTKENDENMLLIRGDRRAADIYLTEFNRLFNHYYFRSVTEALQHRPQPGQESLFLAENADWQAKYEPGKLRAKRLQLFLDLAASRII
ncbi:MAG: phospholipase D-like domain-containing protein [Geodermatophilaceae bacterium]